MLPLNRIIRRFGSLAYPNLLLAFPHGPLIFPNRKRYLALLTTRLLVRIENTWNVL
jgi:hypothetical protein